MQRHVVEFKTAFKVVPPLKRRLLAEPSASPRSRFLMAASARVSWGSSLSVAHSNATERGRAPSAIADLDLHSQTAFDAQK